MDDKWPYFFHVWQIFRGQKKSQTTRWILTQKQLECLLLLGQDWKFFSVLVDPARSQSYQSNESHAMSTRALKTIFVYFLLIEMNNNFCWLSFHLQKCRFFAFSRIFNLIDENFQRISRKSYREAWKTSLPIHFVQISSLTVVLLSGWVKTFCFFLEKLDLFIF